MVHAMDPRYDLPSRKYFSNTAIPALYQSTCECVQKELDTIQFFAATTDLWSSSTSEPYMSYTVHYIDSDFNIQTRCLQTLYAPENHTAANLASVMTETLQTWRLVSSKQVCITNDSGVNVVRACKDLDWLRLPCFGHNLYLAVQHGVFNDTRLLRVLGLCRKFIGDFSHSRIKKSELREAQDRLKLPCHSLVIDCATRWGSTEKMASRVILLSVML